MYIISYCNSDSFEIRGKATLKKNKHIFNRNIGGGKHAVILYFKIVLPNSQSPTCPQGKKNPLENNGMCMNSSVGILKHESIASLAF